MHEEAFIKILEKYHLPIDSPVPLVSRYSKSRRWSAEELGACLRAHDRGISVALMSAALNRNPQDIIFRLLDERHGEPGGFREVGLKNAKKWTGEMLAAGRELFEAGLTAWRIGALFGIDFEGVEKLLYQGREGYGHAKKNPFAICTDHKQIVNRAIIRRRKLIQNALEAFAGEGRFARIISEAFPSANLLCIEQDASTFDRGVSAHQWAPTVQWKKGDNLPILQDLVRNGAKFDLVDLDPFVSCREQIDFAWKLLADNAALFITFGGEYRRSFIGTNRKAIQRRYGWLNESLSNSDYLEIIPSYFFGWVAHEAAANGFILKLDYCVRYPNNCRYWTTASAAQPEACKEWYLENVIESESGYQWKNLSIPRFREVRNRVSELETGVPFSPSPKKQVVKKVNKQLEFPL